MNDEAAGGYRHVTDKKKKKKSNQSDKVKWNFFKAVSVLLY